MKLLIVSDNHRNTTRFQKILGLEAPFDMMVHAGDFEGTENYFEMVAGDEIPFKYVGGNMDDGMLGSSLEFVADRYRVYLTHGHLVSVSYGPDTLLHEAAKARCRIAIFGHTHVPGIAWTPDGKSCRWRRLMDYDNPDRLDSWYSKTELGGPLAGGILLINPGSFGRPRQPDRRPSYATLEIDRDGCVYAQIKYL